MRLATSDLQRIPGIGPSMEQDLIDLGFQEMADLRDQDPQKMYRDLSELRGVRMDPCVLYVFRCAVYFCSNEMHDPELLKWWNWKGREIQGREDRAAAQR